MGYVDKAVMAHLKSVLHSGWVVLDGTKYIADIEHADTLEHTMTLKEAGLPENAKLILVRPTKTFGAGNFKIYTTLGGSYFYFTTGTHGFWPVDDGGVLRYGLTQANDVWDIYVYGLFHSGRLLG